MAVAVNSARDLQDSIRNFNEKNLDWEWAKTFWMIPIIGWIFGTILAAYAYIGRAGALENLSQKVEATDLNLETKKPYLCAVNTLLQNGVHPQMQKIKSIFGDAWNGNDFPKTIFPIYLNLARMGHDLKERHFLCLPQAILGMIPQNHNIQIEQVNALKGKLGEIEKNSGISEKELNSILCKICGFEGFEQVSCLIAGHAVTVDACWETHKFKGDDARTIKLFQYAPLLQCGDDPEDALRDVKKCMDLPDFEEKLKAWRESMDAYRIDSSKPEPQTNVEFLKSCMPK